LTPPRPEGSGERAIAPAIDAAEWFARLKAELLTHDNPYRDTEFFRRLAAGTLTRDQVRQHLAQHYLTICYFPRIFSGIHGRCEDLAVRKECTKHLVVEDLGYFRGRIGATPDHVELFKRIGDDVGMGRDGWDRIEPLPETAALIAFYRWLGQEAPWPVALCTTAFLEAAVGQMSAAIAPALIRHYGCRPEWGGMNYTVHEEAEREESGDTERAILGYLETPEDLRRAEKAIRDLVARIAAYAAAALREFRGGP
jgi:pyrroloquinoline quinone (PQQ) biosynthesis protein C